MSLIEKYVETLEALTGKPFQEAVCTRLKNVVPSFQFIPDKGGDGGLDGYSHNGETGYCCYGLELDPAKDEDDYVSMIAEKFQKDLRRLFEVEVKPKKKAVQDGLNPVTANTPTAIATNGPTSAAIKFQHVPNKELESVLGQDVKMSHIRLLVNRFESKKVLGRIQTAFNRYKTASKCRFVDPLATLVLDGPKQLAQEHQVDELTLSLARRQQLFERLSGSASTVVLPKVNTLEMKLQTMKQIRPGHDSTIDAMGNDFKRDWKLALAAERELSDAAENLHRALDRGKQRLLAKVNKLMTESDEPWNELTTAGDLAEEMLKPILEEWFGDLFIDVCNGEVAALIGDCPIGWEALGAPNA